jgi:NADH:ubiquinone oxidoreductase subunit 6 (subunit J)
MTLQQIAFLILSAVTLGAALMVVTLRNVSRVVLGLILSFLGITGLFILLGALHLAVAQLLVCIGGVFTLIVIGASQLDRVEADASVDGSLDGETVRETPSPSRKLRRNISLLLAHDLFGSSERERNQLWLGAALSAAALCAALAWAIYHHDWVTSAPGPLPSGNLMALARTLADPRGLALPAGAALVMLLIASIGALSIVRRR